jgi:hypothetical protein
VNANCERVRKKYYCTVEIPRRCAVPTVGLLGIAPEKFWWRFTLYYLKSILSIFVHLKIHTCWYTYNSIK